MRAEQECWLNAVIDGKSKICPTVETVNYLIVFLYVHMFKHVSSKLCL